MLYNKAFMIGFFSYTKKFPTTVLNDNELLLIFMTFHYDVPGHDRIMNTV